MIRLNIWSITRVTTSLINCISIQIRKLFVSVPKRGGYITHNILPWNQYSVSITTCYVSFRARPAAGGGENERIGHITCGKVSTMGTNWHGVCGFPLYKGGVWNQVATMLSGQLLPVALRYITYFYCNCNSSAYISWLVLMMGHRSFFVISLPVSYNYTQNWLMLGIF